MITIDSDSYTRYGQVTPLLPNHTLGIVSHKIHYICNGEYYTTGGFPDYVKGLAAHFCKTILVVPVHRTKSIARLRLTNYPRVRIVPLPRWAYKQVLVLLTWPYLARKIACALKECDIINIIMFTMLGFPAINRIDSRGQTIVMTIAGDAFREWAIRLKNKPIRRWLLNPVIRYFHNKLTHVLQSHFTFARNEEIARLYNLLPEKYRCTYSSTFSLQDIATRQITPPIPGEPIRLVSVGRFQKGKGMEFLLDAMACVTKKNLKFDLTIIGDGTERRALEQKRDVLGLKSNIHFMGYIAHGPEFDKVMSRSHAFIFCSLHEGAPKVVIEAFKYGLPVLATKVGAIPTVVKENVNGWLIEPGKVDSIVNAMELISAMDSESWNVMSGRNLTLAAQYTIEKLSRNMLQTLIDRVILRSERERD